MSNEKMEEFQTLMSELPEHHTRILKEILEAEKTLLHRENLQGSNIVSQIMYIVRERVDL